VKAIVAGTASSRRQGGSGRAIEALLDERNLDDHDRAMPTL
jgi:hypothetical protein